MFVYIFYNIHFFKEIEISKKFMMDKSAYFFFIHFDES